MADDNSIIVELIASGKDEFVRSLTDSANSASNLAKKVDVLDKSLDENNKTTKDYSKNLSDNTKKVIDNNNAVDKLIAGEINARTAVRELKKEMIQLALQGKQNSAEYLKLKDTLGNLSDTIGDVSAEISQAGSDTRGLDQTIRVATTLTAGFSVLKGATALFGTENKKLEETIVKVNSLMLVLNGLQQIQAELTKKDSIFTQALTKAKLAFNVVVGQSTGVMKLFRIALASTGILLLISIIATLVANFDKLKNYLYNLFPALKQLGANFDVIKDKVINFVKGAVLSFINSFIEAYNSSLLLRYAISVVGATFQSVGDVIVTIAKNIGAVFTTLWSAISDPKNAITNLKKGFNQIVTNFKDLGKNVYDNFSQGLENAKKSKLNLIDMDKLFPKSSKATDKGKEIGTDIKKGAKDEIEDKPLEVQIDVSPQVSFVGESLKLQIEDLKKEIQFLFNDIFTSGDVPLANPQLQSLLAQLKEAEKNLKIFEDAYNAIFEQFTDDGVQLPPLLDEFDIDNFTSSIGELTSIGKDKYKEYYDYIQSLREQDIINEEIANDAIQKLNESRQNTIIERANVAKNIYSEFANVITGITDTISRASKQRYEQDVSELEQKKKEEL